MNSQELNMAISEAKKKADEKWKKANLRQIKFSFNRTGDKDVLDKLDSVENKTEYVRELIRDDIKKVKN